MQHIIYKTINLVNNKYYIGKHSQHKDDDYLGSGKYLINAIKKYGRENFIRKTLEIWADEDECYLREFKMIQYHLDDPLCYNIAEGGRGFTSGINPKRSGNKGKDNPMYGRKHTDEAKEIMSQKKIGISRNVGVPFTKERKANISKTLKESDYKRFNFGAKTKNTVWWNNGTKHKRTEECPGPEWIQGRINIDNKLGGIRVKYVRK